MASRLSGDHLSIEPARLTREWVAATTTLGAVSPKVASWAADAAAEGSAANPSELAGLDEALYWCGQLEHRANQPGVLRPAVILAALTAERSDPDAIGSWLYDAGVPASLARLVGRLSCLDRNVDRPLLDSDADGAVVVDARLAVLSRPPDAYRNQLRTIRSEDASSQRRWAQVRGLLDREAVYATPECRANLEGRARYNLALEAAELSPAAIAQAAAKRAATPSTSCEPARSASSADGEERHRRLSAAPGTITVRPSQKDPG